MGARQKLNGCYFLGSLCLACVAGWLTASWLVLVIALAILPGLRRVLTADRPGPAVVRRRAARLVLRPAAAGVGRAAKSRAAGEDS